VFEKRVFVYRKAAKNAERIFLNNPVRGGIVQTSPGLRPSNYAVDFVDLKQRFPLGNRPQGKRKLHLSVLSTERVKNFSSRPLRLCGENGFSKS
jgi:hypothetical protein